MIVALIDGMKMYVMLIALISLLVGCIAKEEVDQAHASSTTSSPALAKEGAVSDRSDSSRQGLPTSDDGNVSGLKDFMKVEYRNLYPRQTKRVEMLLNLDASERILQNSGSSFVLDGGAIGVTQVGVSQSTTTTLLGASITPSELAKINLSLLTPVDFSISFSASTGNTGTVDISLNTAAGTPAFISSFNDFRTVANVINAQIFSPPPGRKAIDVIATAVEEPGGDYRLKFTSLTLGEKSLIEISNADGRLGLPAMGEVISSTSGIAAVSNGYPAQTIEITDPGGNVVTYGSPAGASASTIASDLSALGGVSATAQTQMRLVAGNYNNLAGNLKVNLNGVYLMAPTLNQLGDEINTLMGSKLPGVFAYEDTVTGDLLIRSSTGDDFKVSIESSDDGDSIEIMGDTPTISEVLEVDYDDVLSIVGANASSGNAIVVGGQVHITLSKGYSVDNPNPLFSGLYGMLDNLSPAIVNGFDPSDQGTYNSATSMTIFDSLGNSHVMTQYFVRQGYYANNLNTAFNHWLMYVQIDGRDVGGLDTSLVPPANTLPTRASYHIYFNEDGLLNKKLSDEIIISNWDPLDETGNSNGAMGPKNILTGGAGTAIDSLITSNFVIDLAGTTQFGSSFSIYEADQNGYPFGRLSSLNIDDSGSVFASYTNGESKVLGQLLLSDSVNIQDFQELSE